MKLSNVKLVFAREVRDQLRDRRTVFTIAVLPILLYPLLGMSFLQVAQFVKKHPTRIWIIGKSELPKEPVLIVKGKTGERDRFAEHLCLDAEEAKLLELTVRPGRTTDVTAEDAAEMARQALASGKYDAVVYFPPNFAQQIQKFRAASKKKQDQAPAENTDDVAHVPQPEVFFDTAEDKSRIANERVCSVLHCWRTELVQENLSRRKIPVQATEPFELKKRDLAPEQQRGVSAWSKILLFVVLVWALTGAFYPAIDLCAGEKERGTLETLLSSPAMRSEIVWGKLLAIMVFSIATSLLNLVSLGITGTFIIGQLQRIDPLFGGLGFGPPPVAAMAWLLPALVPVSALFSALALAVAALARSTREGQYYLMPLLLISMPLMILPMLPAAELDLGNSLIPVTGLMLLLRSLMEGHYSEALLYVAPVTAMTAVCCLLAIRWAIGQFNNESVLFRESERWGVGLWLAHLLRDREDTPSVPMAVMCGLLLLLMRFFASLFASPPATWGDFVFPTLVVLIALIATPALLMTLMLTRSPRKTLLLRLPPSPWRSLAGAAVLAVAIHPVAMVLANVVFALYPLGEEADKTVRWTSELISHAPLWQAILVIALAPAICEELAFRGFVLSGLRHMGHKWGAIVLSAVFFGVTHGILQQSLTAAALGVVIGYLAVQTGSLLPCILFHLTYNAMAVLIGRLTPELMAEHPSLALLFQQAGEGPKYSYSVFAIAYGAALTLALLLWFRGLPHRLTKEECLQRVLDHQSAHAGANAHTAKPVQSESSM